MRYLSMVLLGAACAWAQEGGAGAGGGAPTGGGAGAGTPTTTSPGSGLPGSGGRLGGQQNDPFGRSRFPEQMEMQRPIFLSGKVMLEDGTPPTETVTIERYCGFGTPRPEGYTDSKGRFSFQLGGNLGVMPDASVGNDEFGGIGGGMGGARRQQVPGGAPGQRQITERDLQNCEIRATLPGYRSNPVLLTGRRFMDNPDLGTIILKRLGKVEGVTMSMTTLQAPKDAKKAHEKALNALKKNKPDEARTELQKAVDLYPQYALAWAELGNLHDRTGNEAEALKAYEQALKADAKFIRPYLGMAQIHARKQNWKETADTTDRVIKLNPFDYPTAYFLNAVAQFNLQNIDAAERSAREGLKQDEQHRVPKLAHILGVVLAQKSDFGAAATQMKAYLQLVPNATDADFVRKQIAEVEKLQGETVAAKP